MNTVLNKITATCNGLSINQAFWLNRDGLELANWTADEVNAPHGRFLNREYFKHIINENPYLLHHNTARKYFLDQVISWTSGSFRSVVSIPSRLSDSNNKVVAALSLHIQSLDAAVLPAGYLFAVIDNHGKVLYHSERSRDLNENLLDEFSLKTELQSSIQDNRESVFSTKYLGKNIMSGKTPPLTSLFYRHF